jgi:hypothetical protein
VSGRTILTIGVPDPNAPKVHLTGKGTTFFVAVRPCPDDQPSMTSFPSYIDARTHARSLRFSRNWKLVDEVDASTRKAAEEAESARIEAKRWGRAVGQGG